MMWRAGAVWVLALAVCGPALALELTLPANARQTFSENQALDSYIAPLSGYENGALETAAFEGQVRRGAWKIGSQGLTTLQILAPLRKQLDDAGYRLALECDQNSCGGFDFRFNTEVLPAPSMFVNLRAFRALVVLKGPKDAPDQVVSLLVSTGPLTSHLQIIQAGALSDDSDEIAATGAIASGTVPATSAGAGAQIEQSEALLSTGSVVLDGLDFATGTSDLGPGPFASLQKLADLLARREDFRVALVGHTDSVGGLEGNIALSKRRAASVRKRLIDAYGVPAARLDAEGMGYLSPVASNLEQSGREANRRVEAVLLSP